MNDSEKKAMCKKLATSAKLKIHSNIIYAIVLPLMYLVWAQWLAIPSIDLLTSWTCPPWGWIVCMVILPFCYGISAYILFDGSLSDRLALGIFVALVPTLILALLGEDSVIYPGMRWIVFLWLMFLHLLGFSIAFVIALINKRRLAPEHIES